MAHRAFFDSPTETLSNLQARVTRHTVDDILGVRDHQSRLALIRSMLDAQESRGRKLVDLRMSLAVQMQRHREALAMCADPVADDWGVVAADFGGPGPIGRGTVEVLENHRWQGFHAMVRVRGADIYGEDVLCGRCQTQVGRRAENHRTDVQQCRRVGGRDEFGVVGHRHVDGGEKGLFGDGGDGHMGRRVCHAFGVEIWPENEDFIVGGSERLQSLVRLLAVIERWCEPVNLYQRVADKPWCRPHSCLEAEAGFNMAVDCSATFVS